MKIVSENYPERQEKLSRKNKFFFTSLNELLKNYKDYFVACCACSSISLSANLIFMYSCESHIARTVSSRLKAKARFWSHGISPSKCCISCISLRTSATRLLVSLFRTSSILSMVCRFLDNVYRYRHVAARLHALEKICCIIRSDLLFGSFIILPVLYNEIDSNKKRPPTTKVLYV